MSKILIVEDEVNIGAALCQALTEKRHQVRVSGTGEDALAALERDHYHLVITDLKLPGSVSGMEVLRHVRSTSPDTPVLMMTAFGTIEHAVEAMKEGAADYVTKPFLLDEIELRIERWLDIRRVQEEREFLSEERRASFGKLVGGSPAMREVFRKIDQVAPSASTVLIEGETGTGKELVAWEIHQRSPRAAKPFVVVHCAALSPGVIESELFGHEKGSFTGAAGRRKGRLELAHEGTLLLDEVGDIPLEIQVKLLRVIQNRTVEHVGGNESIAVDLRILGATHRDLRAMIRDGTFREDLYWRINVFPIGVPPLRERPGDIPLLARHFIEGRSDGRSLTLTPEGERLLTGYPWPGNVRELENVIERAVLLSTDRILRIDLALPSAAAAPSENGPLGLAETLAAEEEKLIREAMKKTDGNQSQAAQRLGIQRSTLQYKLVKYGIPSGKP